MEIITLITTVSVNIAIVGGICGIVVSIFCAGAWCRKVNTRLNTVELAIKEIKSSIDKLSDKVDKLTDRFDELSGRFDELTGRVDKLTGRVDELSGRVDKLNKHFLGKNNPVHTEQNLI